jgi:hypothetical protein
MLVHCFELMMSPGLVISGATSWFTQWNYFKEKRLSFPFPFYSAPSTSFSFILPILPIYSRSIYSFTFSSFFFPFSSYSLRSSFFIFYLILLLTSLYFFYFSSSFRTTLPFESCSRLLYRFSKSLLLRQTVELLWWGIGPSQGLCLQFNSFLLMLQADANLGPLCCRDFLNPY